MDVLPHGRIPVSPSQIETFLDCPRKWAWGKLEGLPSPSNKYAEFGTAMHAVLEAYMRTGKLDTSTDPGMVASAGVGLLPPPGSCDIEQYFELVTDIAVYRGYMDLHRVWSAATESPLSVTEVYDHKSTGDFKWMKEKNLRTDPQGVIYAAAAMMLNGTTVADLTWVYYLRNPKKPQAKTLHLRVLQAEVEPEFDRLHAVVGEMKKLRDAYLDGDIKIDKDIPPTVTSCSKYGGCPFVNNCKLSPRDMARSIYVQSSLADKLKKRQQEKDASNGNGAADPAKPAAETSTPAATTQEQGDAAAKRIAERLGKSQGVNPPTGTPSAAEGPKEAAPVGQLSGASLESFQRDRFAADAMAALIARREHALTDPSTAGSIATMAYEFADAMMKAKG